MLPSVNVFEPYSILYTSNFVEIFLIIIRLISAIFYEILYKCVFRLEEVDYAVGRMLHDKIARYNTDLNMEFFATG